MKLAQAALYATGLGLVLVFAAMIWPKLMGPGRVWTEEQAREHSHAAARMHALSEAKYELQHGASHEGHGHAHGHAHSGAHAPGQEQDPATVAAEVEAATERYEKSRDALEGAKSLRTGPATLMKWAGVLLMTLGVAGYFVQRNAAG